MPVSGGRLSPAERGGLELLSRGAQSERGADLPAANTLRMAGDMLADAAVRRKAVDARRVLSYTYLLHGSATQLGPR